MVSGSVATAIDVPFASSSLAVIVRLPFAKLADGTKLHVPRLFAFVVPTAIPSTRTTIMAPGLATPVKVGLANLVMLSPRTPLSLLGASASVSKADAGMVRSQATPRLARANRPPKPTPEHSTTIDAVPPFWLQVGIWMAGVLPLRKSTATPVWKQVVADSYLRRLGFDAVTNRG